MKIKLKDKEKEPIRTYKFSSQYTNSNKIDKIYKLSFQYKFYYNNLMKKSISEFFRDRKLPKYLDKIEDCSCLSARFKQTCGSQVKANINAWLCSIAENCNRIIFKRYKTDEERLPFYYINKYHLWFKDDIYCDKGKVKIPVEIIRLSRKIFKHCMGKFPVMHNCCMILDKKVAEVQKTDNSFDYWIKLSTLIARDVIYLPIKSYDYYNNIQGKDKKAIQILVHKDKVDYGFIKDIDMPKYEGFSEIFVDHGLNSVLSSSSGSQYGKKFFKLLKKYDNIINWITKDRMKRGLYGTCPKLQRLYAKVRNLVKNEIGRCLNRMIKLEQPKVIIMEDSTNINETVLSHGVSRRLLQRSGFAKIPERAKGKCDLNKIVFILVNSAYNSQRCSRCGYVHRNNRDGSKFKCLNCGFKINADYNASINISVRRSNTAIDIYTPYKKVKEILDREFLLNQAVYSAASGS
jgi:putative transposase